MASPRNAEHSVRVSMVLNYELGVTNYSIYELRIMSYELRVILFMNYELGITNYEFFYLGITSLEL